MANLNIIQVPSQTNTVDERAAYDSGTVTTGHGQASGVYVVVQKGTRANVNIDFTISTISEESYHYFKERVWGIFSNEEQQKLEENYGGFGMAGGLFSGMFGLLFGGGDYNHYKDKSASFNVENDEKKEEFTKNVYNLSVSEFHVTGQLIAEGTSFIPVTVSSYVQTTKLKFSDGKELHVLSLNDSQAAAQNGSTKGVQSSPEHLSITPL
ncbi:MULTISPECIES: hypothetical protein [Nostocales]|uniref:hypothetical protein n=1 Tax=Nostocales TaxID=1161 RepID=UPI001687E8C5|nr:MULTISPECIES: hypothetical protein [Nostocales]MBD2302045.1 hypothetical protein [Nostoc sp. FACHB-190]MBD2490794.1 hypothetical protein [Aulosira sp. FACHB-615]